MFNTPTQPQLQKILGIVPSKSNAYKIITIGPKGKQHSSLAKTDILNKYEDSFYMQCNHYRNKLITNRFEIHLNVFNPSDRADLDNSLKVILDCLQTCKAIKNDRLCVKIVAQKFIDKTNPRIEFSLKEII